MYLPPQSAVTNYLKKRALNSARSFHYRDLPKAYPTVLQVALYWFHLRHRRREVQQCYSTVDQPLYLMGLFGVISTIMSTVVEVTEARQSFTLERFGRKSGVAQCHKTQSPFYHVIWSCVEFIFAIHLSQVSQQSLMCVVIRKQNMSIPFFSGSPLDSSSAI